MKNHTGWDTDLSRRFYGKPNDLVKHLRGRSENRTELDCVAADEIERLTADLATTESILESLQNKFEQVTGENTRLTAEVTRYRKALWEEYLEAFNDLGVTRQARWKSATEYANSLMTDFDRDSGSPAPSENCPDCIPAQPCVDHYPGNTPDGRE